MAGLELATITDTVTGTPIPVAFNPEEYTINRDLTYAQMAVPGLSAPVLQFVHGNAQTLEMELLVDTYEASGSLPAGSDVRALTGLIVGLMDIAPARHAPPPLLFTWGLLSFKCVLGKCVQRFVMFRPDGVPVRARLTVTFTEYRDIELEAMEVKRETADYTKTHLVAEGETLSAIAHREYGDAAKWRPIALRNGLDDPRQIAPAMRLAIPRLPYRDPETGEALT